MIHKQINPLKPAIDSMTVVTPINFLDIDEQYFSNILKVDSRTGDILSTSNKNIEYNKDGIKIRAMVVSLFGIEHLSITYTSKMLTYNYFDGINSTNFSKCFNFAKLHLYFTCDYLTYLRESKVFDMDLKFDFLMSDEIYSDFLASHKHISGIKLFRSSGARYLDTSYYSGLQFINRKDEQLSKPFLKFYAKSLELYERSNEFYTLFLSNNPYFSNYLRRCETTIKNSLHFNKLLISNKLFDVLQIPSNQIIETIYQAYFLHYTPIFSKNINTDISDKFPLSLADWLYFSAVLEIMRTSKQSLKLILNTHLNTHPALSSASKSRKLKTIKDKFKVFLQIQKNSDLNNFKMTPKDVFFDSPSRG